MFHQIFRQQLTSDRWRFAWLPAIMAMVIAAAARPAEATPAVPVGYTATQFVTGLTHSPSQLADDPATGTLYFAENGSTLYSASPIGTVSTVTSDFLNGDFNPYQWTDMKFIDGAIYMATSEDLDQYDLSTGVGQVLTTQVAGSGDECGIAAVGNLIYITTGNNTTDTLQTYDLTTNTLATVNSSLPDKPSSLEYNSVNGMLYFASLSNGAYYQYDPAANTYVLIATEASSSDANFAIDPSGQDLYVRVSGGVDQIAISDGTITHFATGLPGGPNDSDVTFGPSSSGSGQSLYVASGTSIYEIAGFSGLTTTMLTSDANPAAFGQAVTLTATVTGGDGGGTVQFAIDGTDVGSPLGLTADAASYTTSVLAVGDHTVTAVYSGDANGVSSTGTGLTQTVNKADTTTTVVVAPNPATDIQPLTVTATVAAAAPGTGTPTGSVQFAVDGTTVGLPVALSSGVALYHYPGSLVLPGSHTITATYSGDTDFLADAAGQTTETLTASAATHFIVTAPATATAGTATAVTVRALDALGQTATSYTGIVHLTSSDRQATLPPNAALVGGIGHFSVTLETAGAQTVTATDAVTASITGISSSIAVSAASAGHVAFVQQPTTTLVGAPITPAPSAAVTDSFGNPVSGASVTITLVSGSGVLSGTATQTTGTNGIATFAGLAVNLPGAKTLQAVTGASLKAASSQFDVTADDRLTAQGVNIAATAQTTFSALVATFTDTDKASPASDFTTTIDWGDGTTSAGTVTGSAGLFTVTASHAYASAGSYKVVTTITDTEPGGPTTDATAAATVKTNVLHTFQGGLQLLSVPRDFSGIALGTALSQINPKLYVWLPGELQYAESPSAPADALRPGQGYWTDFRQATDLYNLGMPTPTNAPFAIALKKGWNMIGDPFPSSVSLSNVTVKDASGSAYSFSAANGAALIALTTYSYPAGSTQYQTQGADGSLTPYAGYWIYAFTDCTLEVPAP